MDIIHPIRTISQSTDIKPYFWKRRSCGIASLCMVKNHYNRNIHKGNLQKMIEKGVEIGAYRPGVGWTHQGLIDLAKYYGFHGERFDYAQTEPQKGFEALLTHAAQGPVIASIHKDFKKKNGGHLVVVNGYKQDSNETLLYITDPKSKKNKHNKRIISKERFVNGWKKRFIVIRPDNVA